MPDELKVDETEDISQEDEAASFSKGFAKILSDGDDDNSEKDATPSPAGEPEAKQDETATTEETTAKPEEAKADDAKTEETLTPEQQELADLRKAKRRLEGKVGELMMKAPAKADATPLQPVKAELKDPEAMKDLVTEFPEYQPVNAELSALHQTIADNAFKMEQLEAGRQEQMASAGQLAVFEFRHPDHKAVAAEPEFVDWSITGGPAKDVYLEMKSLQAAAVDERYSAEHRVGYDAKANQMIDSWAVMHPNWWAKKGNGIFSDSAVDASNLLDNYKAHKRAATSKSIQDEKRKQRISGAVTPASSGTPPATGVSDDQAFSNGFQKGMRR
jgi:hypothetical protein